MKILVINPPSADKTINRDMAGGLGYGAGTGVVLPPIDLLNIVATLIKKKHKVIFVDAIAQRIDDLSVIKKIIEDNKIEVIISGLALPTISEDVEFALYVRKFFPKINFIFKTGINYKQILEKVISDSKVNLIIFGECDLTIESYILGSKRSACIYLKNGLVEWSPIGLDDRIKNLDELPVAARDVSKYKMYKYGLLPGVVTTVQTSRGCPYPCGYYCPYPLVQGKAWRAMSNSRVIKELKAINKMGIKSVLFRDATFTLDNKRTLELCNLIIKNKLKFKWWCETRINVLNIELLKKMKQAGCVGINVGIETLDQELIIYQGKPGVTLEAVKIIREQAKKMGVRLHFLMIIGLPDENLKTINNTFNYLVKLHPESVGFSTITPYPGTEMFVEAMRDGLIQDFDWNKFNGSISNMRTKYLSSADMRMLRNILQLTSFALKRPRIIAAPIILINGYVLKLWQKLRGE